MIDLQHTHRLSHFFQGRGDPVMFKGFNKGFYRGEVAVIYSSSRPVKNNPVKSHNFISPPKIL